MGLRREKEDNTHESTPVKTRHERSAGKRLSWTRCARLIGFKLVLIFCFVNQPVINTSFLIFPKPVMFCLYASQAQLVKARAFRERRRFFYENLWES